MCYGVFINYSLELELGKFVEGGRCCSMGHDDTRDKIEMRSKMVISN